jgi:AcrR family transcriptional regulator
VSRRYDSPVRRERTAQTRERIVTAGAALAQELSSWDWRKLTIRAVAERAGVHERTVYRHFPTEQDLRAAVVQRLEQDAGVQVEGIGLDEVADHVVDLFGYLSAFSSSTERPLDASLAAMDQKRKDAILAAVTEAAPDWGDDDRLLAAAMLDVLWGVPSYRRLVSGWGLQSDEALRGTTWVIDLVVEAVRAGRAPAVRRRPARRTEGRVARGAAHRDR